jgi:hypothetical protein
MNKLKAFWYSLPPKVQATVVLFATTAGTFFAHTISESLLNPGGACWTWVCLRHTLTAAVLAGFVAAKTFYMRPGPGPNAANLGAAK